MPDNYDALVLRGRLYLMQGKPDKAVAELDRMCGALLIGAPEVQLPPGPSASGCQ